MAKPRQLRKVALTVYVDPEHAKVLRDLSRRTHIPQQFYLREGVTWALGRYVKERTETA